MLPISNAEKVYNAVRRIPAGKVSTYGRVAEQIGMPKASRMVGKVLHENPDPSQIKCHRIVFKDGSLSENFAFGGIKRHAELLSSQGVAIDMQRFKVINLDRYLMNFKNQAQ